MTTIVEMPYDEGLLVCSAEAVIDKAEDVARNSYVDAPCGASWDSDNV